MWLEKKVPEVTLQWEETSVREPWRHTEKLSLTLLPFFGGGIDDGTGPFRGLGYLACLAPLFPLDALNASISRGWALTSMPPATSWIIISCQALILQDINE